MLLVVAVAALFVTSFTTGAGSVVQSSTVGAVAAPTPLPSLHHAFVPGHSWIDTTDRATVLAAHATEYQSVPPVLAWAGEIDACVEGTSPTAYRKATLDRVNYYRAMAGVPAVVTEDPALSAKAQEAALMMSAEGALTHHPAPSYACFTDVGQEAAGNSNLYLGRTGPVAIDGYIEDPGDHNTDVGHRNTILHPPTRAMGVGDVAASDDGHAANALWVFDEHVFDETAATLRPEVREQHRFVAWPPRGYVPGELVYPRWSVTMADVDFSRAQVSMWELVPGERARPVELTVVNRSGAPGHVPLPTFVWEPDLGLDGDPERDTSYFVSISGLGPLEPAPVVAEAAGTGILDSGPPPALGYTVTVLGRNPEPIPAPEHVLAAVRPAP